MLTNKVPRAKLLRGSNYFFFYKGSEQLVKRILDGLDICLTAIEKLKTISKSFFHSLSNINTSRSISISINRVIPRGMVSMASCNLKMNSAKVLYRNSKRIHKLKILWLALNTIPVWRVCKKSCQNLKSIISYIKIILCLPKNPRETSSKVIWMSSSATR